MMNTADNKPSSSFIGNGNTTASSEMTSSFLRSPSTTKSAPYEYDVIPDLPMPSRIALAFLGHWFPKTEKTEAKPLVFPWTENGYGTMKSSLNEDEKGVEDRWLSMNDDPPLIPFDGNMNICEEQTSIRRRLKGQWIKWFSFILIIS